MSYDYYTMTQQQDGSWTVYGWDVYPSHSVLAGQPRKNWLDNYETRKAALVAYPDATPSSKWTEPVASVPHCPPADFDHYDAGEYWGEDDY